MLDEKKLYCNTGAEVNVIDDDLLERLVQNDNKIKFHSSRKLIRCANNSKVSVSL